MVDKREFQYIGEVRGQMRPRASTIWNKSNDAQGKKNVRARMYKDNKDASYEKSIRNAYLQQWAGCDPIKDSFKLYVNFTLSVPKSKSEKKKNGMIGKPCTKKPDIDNCVKSILDSLNGVAFEDDKLCSCIMAYKKWGNEDRISVTLLSEQEDNNDQA